MPDDQMPPEEHLRRLTLAARAVELVPSTPEAELASWRAGRAGDVPLQLSLRKDGTLDVRAEAPQPLPEGMEAWRDAQEGPQIKALNPASARRLWAHPEVRRRLETLYELAPHARVSGNAVLLQLAPEVKEEQLQGALRATLRAASALAHASQELARAAEQNREKVRSTASPELLEGGRRFIRLEPEDARLDRQQRERLLIGAEGMLLRGDSPFRIRDYLLQGTQDDALAEALFLQAIENTSERVLKRKLLTLLIVIPILVLSVLALTKFRFLTGEKNLRLAAFIAFLASITYFVWKKVGQFFERREARERDEA